MNAPAPTTKEIYALAQYCATADALMRSYERETPSSVPVREMFVGKHGGDIAAAWLYLRLWFATLYVVLEGWETLGLQSVAVDESLASLRTQDEIKILRRFRNAVFHFQRDPHDDRLEDLLILGIANDMWTRITKLHQAFLDYFAKWRATADLTAVDPYMAFDFDDE